MTKVLCTYFECLCNEHTNESRILWKYKESDEWKRADIDDLIRAYEDNIKVKNIVECYTRTCKNNKNGKCEANNIILEFGCSDCDGR